MNLYRRIMCGILCAFMVLSLSGYGLSEDITAEAQVAVDSYLTIAQRFIDSESFDSAISVLEQAKEIAEDPRIDALLARIEELRSVPLDVVVSQMSPDLQGGTVQIYSVTAVQRFDGFVRYTVDYAATEGMYIQLEGTGLSYTSYFSTTGTRDTFVFEIPASDLRAIGRTFRLFFAFDKTDVLCLSLLTNWPGDVLTAAMPLTLEPGDLTAIYGCEINSVTVQAVDSEKLYYSVDYTAPGPGMPISIQLGSREPEIVQYTDTGRRQLSFILNRDEVQNADRILLRIQEREGSNKGASVDLAGNSLPERENSAVVKEVLNLPYSVDNRLQDGKSYQIHNITAQLLASGFVRYRIEYAGEEGLSCGAHGYISGAFKSYSTVMDASMPGVADIYLSYEDLKNSNETICSFSGEDAAGRYELNIPHIWNNATTEGVPVGEPISLPAALEQPPKSDAFSFQSCVAQPLNNGYVRLTFSFTAPEHRLCYIRDIPALFHMSCGTGKQSGAQTITVDIPGDSTLYNNTLRFCVNMYTSQTDGPMFVQIDVSDILGKNAAPAKIFVNVLTHQAGTETAQSGNKLDELTQQLAETAAELISVPEVGSETAMRVDTSMIQPLEVTRELVIPKAKDGIQPYDTFTIQAMPENADLSDNLPLAYSLIFSDKTNFASKMPAGYNPDALLEWGKDPGLGVNVLHEMGYTGKGAVIAYVDQPIRNHEAYVNVNLHYVNNADAATSMHGPAVLSLLAGDEIGTAPDAEVWFYGHSAWYADQKTHAECLYQIIEQNKVLPEGEKITMVGFSDQIDDSEKNALAFREAVAACEEAGIMVWFCGEYASAAFYPLSDRDNFDNVICDGVYGGFIPMRVHVPAGSRTTATGESGQYIYWSSGGLSWTMPYVLGLYAIAKQIDPSLSQNDLRKMIVDTSYQKDSMKIVNPVEFVAAALEGTGRGEDAQELRNAANNRMKYTYAIMNKSNMSREDISATENYLKEISDSRVLLVDSSGISSAQQLYTILQADHLQRGGTVAGVQILGDSGLVPTFEVGYQVQMENSVDNMGTLLTDLFYGNFDNRASDLSKSYNVKDHFANGWQIQLVPEWKVVRLPLAKGEFKPFFDKYMAFAETAGLGQQTLINFSNPIFAEPEHQDDMGIFLNRLSGEFEMDLGQYRLYGNQLGSFPVTTDVLGGFTAENLHLENSRGVCEFLINSHGQKNNVDKCWYEKTTEQRESLVNMDTVNDILGENPYYLDLWTCNNGEGMKNNLTTTALNGKAVGVFSATSIISNNGVNNHSSLQSMAKSNFYWFYLHYLDAWSKGASRSDAFLAAQRAYGNALIVDSQNGIRSNGNYQFNLCNLLGYHNFGVLEPNAAFSCVRSSLHT